MALFRRLFYRKPPDRLLEISDKVYVFDCCFSSEHLEEDEFKDYMNNILVQLQSYFPDASFTVINFRQSERRNLVAEILTHYNISVIEYPHGYHGFPLLPLGMVYQFLRLCDNRLSSEGHQNVLLMHCEKGGWPVLSFMLASLMLNRSQYSEEERTLEMMYKQAPRELLQMFSPLNPFPSHLRYLHYITEKCNGLQWPLCDVPYSLDCLILRDAPYFDGKAGFMPTVRVYGRDPSNLVGEDYRVLFTSLKNKEQVHNFRQADSTQITLDIHCIIQGDVVLECIHMDEDLELEEMKFRIMFNTAFIQNNVLVLNSKDVDIIWGMEDQFTKNFKAEVKFSKIGVGSNTPQVVAIEEDEVEAEEFFEAEEIFSSPDLHDGTRDLDSSSLSELVLDDENTANNSLEICHHIQNLKNGAAQEILILDDLNASPERVIERLLGASQDDEGQRLENEKSDMFVETHIVDSAFVEENTFITRNLRNVFENAFNNILVDNKVICNTVSVDDAKRCLEIKLHKQKNEASDIGGKSFHYSNPEFRTPKMVNLSQYSKKMSKFADEEMSMSEMNGLIQEEECLINPDTLKAFDGGSLGHANSQLEIIPAEVSFKNEESVKVEFPERGSIHNGNCSEFGNFNFVYHNENAKDNHNFEAEEHTILASNVFEQDSKGNRQVISCNMVQNFKIPFLCNERRNSKTENSYRVIGTEFNMEPTHDSQGAQSGNSKIVDWMELKVVNHNWIKDVFVSQNNALLEFSCENKEVHVHRKEHEEQLHSSPHKYSTIAPSDPVAIAHKGKPLLSVGDNEELAEPQGLIMQTSLITDSEDNSVHSSSFSPTRCHCSPPTLFPLPTTLPSNNVREESSTSTVLNPYSPPLHFSAPINEKFSSLSLPPLPPPSHLTPSNLSRGVSNRPLQKSPPPPPYPPSFHHIAPTKCIDPPCPPPTLQLLPPPSPISSMPHASVTEDPPSHSSAPTYHSCPLLSQSSHYGSLLEEALSLSPHQPYTHVKDELSSHSHPPPPPQPPSHTPPLHSRDSPEPSPQPPPHPPPLHSRDSPKCKPSPSLPPPQSSPVKSPSPPPPPPLPPPQSIHLPLSSTVSRSNCSSNHLSSFLYREACQPPPPAAATPLLSKNQSASELLASYLPPLPPLSPIKVHGPAQSLSTTILTPSPFTVKKCDFELLSSCLAFPPPADFQLSVEGPMTRCLSSSPLHPVKKLNTSALTSVEISTSSYGSLFYMESSPSSGRTPPASAYPDNIQGIASNPLNSLPLTVKQPPPESPNCQKILIFPPLPPLPPPPIGIPSAPITEGCKGAPSLPPPLLGSYGQGSTPPSQKQTSFPPLPPLLYNGPVVAPPPPARLPPHSSLQAPTPIFKGASYLPGELVKAPSSAPPPTFEGAPPPSTLLGRPRGPTPSPPRPPTSGGAPPPPPPPLPKDYKVTPTPSPLLGRLGGAPLLHPPTEYDGPPSPSPPPPPPPLPPAAAFPFGSRAILLEPHFPGGHGGAPPPPPSEHHDGAPPLPPTPRGGVPPPPMLPRAPAAPPPPPTSGLTGPPPRLGLMPGGRGLGFARAGDPATSIKKSALKPLHWIKVPKATQGSLWAEIQKHADAQSTTEFDILELETLFSAVVKKPDGSKSEGWKSVTKSDKVHLIDLRRANNTEIMLTKIKMPLSDIMNAALALDESILDSDQVENLIKFCPSKEDMELLKNYTGDKESLGKCEQFFLELMKVPRVEAKLRVLCFKIQFNAQTADIRKSLYTVDSACEEIRNSNKLKEIMKKILSLGNTLNQGTVRGAAIGFRLDSLLKLADTRAANNKMTLMHYLCKVLNSRSPHLMDFHEEFISLEAASKIQLKALAEEQQGVVKGLAKVEIELNASKSDGIVSDVFSKTLKDFTAVAGAEVRSLTALYTTVGKNADGLALYFGEDPARCPFELVVTILLNFVRFFRCAHEENSKLAELEKKKIPQIG